MFPNAAKSAETMEKMIWRYVFEKCAFSSFQGFVEPLQVWHNRKLEKAETLVITIDSECFPMQRKVQNH